jgi:hypothetical protein
VVVACVVVVVACVVGCVVVVVGCVVVVVGSVVVVVACVVVVVDSEGVTRRKPPVILLYKILTLYAEFALSPEKIYGLLPVGNILVPSL